MSPVWSSDRRLLLGVGESFQAPCSYSLIAQSFPLSSRSRANGIYSFGIYVGGGAASLSILLAKHIGWRHTCLAYGLVSMGVGLLYGMTVGKRDGQEEAAYVLARRCSLGECRDWLLYADEYCPPAT